MAKPTTSDDRRLLQLMGRDLTLRSKQADLADEHAKVKREIVDLKAKKVSRK